MVGLDGGHGQNISYVVNSALTYKKKKKKKKKIEYSLIYYSYNK